MSELKFLGEIAWFTISSGASDIPLDVTRPKLEEWFTELGLNAEFLPPPIKGIDAFRSASSSVTDSYSINTQRIKLVIQEVEQTPDYVLRNLVRSTIDSTGRPSSARVAEFKFFRPRRMSAGRVHGSEKVRTMVDKRLSGEDLEHVNAAEQLFLQRYEQFRLQLTPSALRFVIRNYFTYLDAIPIRGGGCYYFANKEKELKALRELTSRLGVGCSMDVLSVVDQPREREMVVRAVEDELELQVTEIIQEMVKFTDANPGKNAPVAKFNKYRNDYRGVQTRCEELSHALNVPLDRPSKALARALEVLQGLRLSTEKKVR